MSDLHTLPIEGAARLESVFGRWPEFRGARLLYLRVDRTGPTATAAFELPEWTERRPNQTVHVTFRWLEVTDVALSGLDADSRVAGLALHPDADGIETVLEPGAGLHGRIRARRLRVADVVILEP